MCGISGIYGIDAPDSVEAMLGTLLHRGPDGDGVSRLPRIVLGHTRLAILDIAGGRQPMQVGDTWISFNGEIYNHLVLRQKYLAGHTFTTHSDTETILHLYRKLGKECISLLDGMFALAIYDRGRLLLGRDPLGIKPLYMAEVDGNLYFASEIKALAQAGSQVADAAREFPPGYWYDSKLGWKQFYALPVGWSEGAQINPATIQARILATLRQAVLKRLLSDAPLGVSLSGGLDSSIVAALAREGKDGLQTFAVGVKGSRDLEAARLAGHALGTVHYERMYSDEDMLRILPEVIFHLESFDPALVRSAIPNYFLAELAGEYVKVFLTGEGADELYAGYDYLADYSEPEALHHELHQITAALHNTNLQRADRLSMAHSLEARVPFLDTASIQLAFDIPPALKLHQSGQPPKALLRQAFAGLLPDEILQRPKEKFSQGAGSSLILAQRAEEGITDADFQAERGRLLAEWNYPLPNKEALYYYRILRQSFEDAWIFPSMGHSRSL